jgi:glycosyltransferase involved in cell wall biosynthesis
MRIGFFGNTNNYPFMLAMGLRRRGHDVQFIVDQADPLYRPEYRYPEATLDRAGWLSDVSPVRFRDFAYPSRRIAHAVRKLRTCDVVVLNQYGPALLPAIRRPALALLTGSDLEVFANRSTIRSFWSNRAHSGHLVRKAFLYFALTRLIRAQRKGIRMCGAIRFFPRGIAPTGDALLEELGVDTEDRLYLPMTDISAVSEAPLPVNDRPRIVCVARLNWKKPMRPGATELDYKGTDTMIRGLAQFRAETEIPVEINLVRKGWDVAATEQLVRDEGLTDLVVWHAEMSQIRLFDLVRECDVVIEQLDASLPGSGAVDALAIGRPVIANWRRELIADYRQLPDAAICQASSATEVCAQLKRLILNKGEMARVAAASRAAVEEHLSSDAAAKQCERLFARLLEVAEGSRA